MKTLTKKQAKELQKCANDIVYFAKNYYKVTDPNKGLIKTKLRRKQKDFLNNAQRNHTGTVLGARQSRKSTTLNIIALWTVLFKQSQYVGLLAPKLIMSKHNLQNIKDSYKSLPEWMKIGIYVDNKTRFELENGSTIVLSTADGMSFRGMTLNVLLYDEMGYASERDLDTFFQEVYPVLSLTSKCFYASSANHNKPFQQHLQKVSYTTWSWKDDTTRSKAWKKKVINDIGKTRFQIEFENKFV